MYVVESYPIAVIFLIISMFGWGSWANTLKLSPKNWAFPLYYWDYSIGLIIFALLMGFTFGSFGEGGRGFYEDLLQANWGAISSAFIGGVIFNLSNLLIVAATDIAGMAVAFPIAVGLALVIGVIVNYIAEQTGNPFLLFIGVGLITLAIVVNALAYRKVSETSGKSIKKGIIISIISGVIMGFFYRFVAASISADFLVPEVGMMTPYTAVLIFAIGVFISNFLINSAFMYKPVSGSPVTYKDYFKRGSFKIHLIGILGGIIWNVGLLFSLIASEKAGAAISYGMSQGATMIAAAWGVFVWREFKSAPKSVNKLLVLMFTFFIIGLMFIILARTN